MRSKSLWPQWAMTGVSLWLFAAPLLFWAPRVSIYINDSLAGILIAVFAVVVPYAASTGGIDVPGNWSYNPSTWRQRIPIVIIGFLAYVGATYLAFFQMGYTKEVWDPFFNDGTRRVLTSDVSKAFPVSDAGLGAFAYLLECLSGLIGDQRRWRTMPWMSFLFWLLVVPAGVVSIVLVMLQPIAVGAWCAMCLMTAFLTLITIPPAMDEFILTLQFLREKRRQGANLWELFWRGEVVEKDVGVSPRAREDHWIDLSLPWNLCVCAALGVILMAAPSQLGILKPLSDSHYMTGALVITFAVIGMAELGRPLRLANILFGLWAACMPWVLSSGTGTIRALDTVIGALLICLSYPAKISGCRSNESSM